jgi:hypothetical protein
MTEWFPSTDLLDCSNCLWRIWARFHFLSFAKRKAPSLHYSNEWKESRISVTAVHSLHPDMEGLGIRGEGLGTSDRRNQMGEGVSAIFGFSRAGKYHLIFFDTASLLETTGRAATHANLI